MNPQDPYGSVPPNAPTPEEPQPVINVPGQDPYVAPPVQPALPHQQPAVDRSPYDFIVNPAPVKTVSQLAPLAGGSTAKRALIAVGGLAILVIIIAVVSSLIGGGGNKTAPLLSVLQEQTELARVAAQGATSASQEKTKAFASNVQLSVSSAEQQLKTYMTSNHTKFNVKTLGLKHSATVDTQLQAAQSNNTYDATLTSVLQNDLANYSSALKTAYNANPGPKGQQLLTKQFDDVQLLLQQAKQ